MDSNAKQTAGSLNSSTYSSAASSSDSASTTSSTASDASSTSSNTSSSSSSPPSSSTSSPSSQAKLIEPADQCNARQGDHENFELAKMEDLGKTAQILDRSSNDIVQQPDTTQPSRTFGVSQILAGVRQTTFKFSPVAQGNNRNNNNNINTTSGNIINNNINHLPHNQTQQTFASASSSIGLSTSATLLANATNPADMWKTINAKRVRKRRKPVEKKVLAGQMPGNIGGSKTIDELVNFIQSRDNGIQQNGNKANKQKYNSTSGLVNNPNSSSSSSSNHQMAHQNGAKTLSAKIRSTTTTTTTMTTIEPSGSSEESTSQAPAVILANHLEVKDDYVTNQYTFGFFDEQPPNVTTTVTTAATTSQTTKPSTQPAAHQPSSEINTTNNSHTKCNTYNILSQATNARKQTSQRTQQTEQSKPKQKQSKPSLNSENCYVFKDNIEANSFNYYQILKFISSSWESTKAHMVANSHNH